MNYYIRFHIHLSVLILVGLVCITAVPFTNAQPNENNLDWYWGNHAVPPMDVSGFHPIDENHCWISSYTGVISYTKNAGRSWNLSYLEPGFRINSIWFYNKENGLIVGDGGVIFRSADGGKNWTKVESGTESNLIRVIFSDPDNGLIIGHEGVILRSFDGGEKWQPVDAPGNQPDFINVAISSPQHWALIDSTYLYLTDDAGTSWEVLRATVPFTNQYLTAVDRFSEKHYAVAAASIGSNGFQSTIVITTTDKGENWSSFNTWSFNSYSLKYADDNNGYLSNGNNYFFTNDAGKSWELKSQHPRLGTYVGQFYNMRYLHMIGDIMFVIDGIGEVWRSNAEKDSWTNLRKPDNNQYQSLAAHDEVILLGSTNGILRSVDGGLSFETVYDGSGNFLHRLGENKWIAHSFGLYISRDNGITWNRLDARNQNGEQILNIQLITFTDTSKGYIVDRFPSGGSGRFRVYRYINEALWEELEPIHTTGLHAVHAKGDRVWLLGPGNQIQVSDDEGQTWSYQDIVYDVGLRNMTMIDENKGWIITDSLGLLLHTTDGGTSWTTTDTGFDFQINALDYLDQDRVWLAGSNSTILKSEDGGLTFQKQSTPVIVNSDLFTLRTIKVLSDSSGLAAGDHGVILSYGKPLHPDNNDDENVPPEVPGELVLFQNYPNPFNPSTTIKYYLMEPATIRIDIFNVTGRRIKRLEPGLQNHGYHYISVSGGELAAGMYIYAIFRDGVFSGTRKMLLVK